MPLFSEKFGYEGFIHLEHHRPGFAKMMVGNRLLAHINGMQLDDGEPLSISIGITEMQADDDFESLFKRADSALYEAKRSGRNCIYQH